jgi:hypothetical protein
MPPESVRKDWDLVPALLTKLDALAEDVLLTLLTVASTNETATWESQHDLLVEAFSLCGRPYLIDPVLDL